LLNCWTNARPPFTGESPFPDVCLRLVRRDFIRGAGAELARLVERWRLALPPSSRAGRIVGRRGERDREAAQGETGLRLSLTKTALDERGDRLLAREARWLRELEDVPELDGQVPRVIEEGRGAEGWRYLVLSAAPEITGETRAFTSEHARFLACLGKARFRVSDFELAGCCRWLLRALDHVQAFAEPGDAATLRAAFHDCETALLYWTGPYVLAQGDFAPWHVHAFGAQLFVSDWGRARTEASPLDDVLHYVMVQRVLRAGPVTVPFLRSAMKRAYEFAVNAYPEWSWRPQVIGALTLVYLLGATLHHALERRAIDRSHALAGAYLGLLEERAAWMPD
jgi:hypothetical protein